MTDFYKTKVKEKRRKKGKKCIYVNRRAKKKKKQMKMSKWLGCPGHSNNQSEVI